MDRSREYKVLVNYNHKGTHITQSLYSGPHRKHADKALATAKTLGRHGILGNCTVTFFDGFRIRPEETESFMETTTGFMEGGTVPEILSCADYTHPRYRDEMGNPDGVLKEK